MNTEPLYGRELEKCSFGILQELFMEQNTTSVEGKASRESEQSQLLLIYSTTACAGHRGLRQELHILSFFLQLRL